METRDVVTEMKSVTDTLDLDNSMATMDKNVYSPNFDDTDSDSSNGSVVSSNGGGGMDVIIDVECGLNKGVLYLNKLTSGSKGACVLFDNTWLTPNEFQYISGRETAKDWKRSIKHYGKSLKLLIAKGVMTSEPAVCKCEGCVIPNNNDGGVHESHAKIDQENVPPEREVRDTITHSTEVNWVDKDKNKPDVIDGHVAGNPGSDHHDTKAVLEAGGRNILQDKPHRAEEFPCCDSLADADMKTTKKRKSQPKSAEKAKKLHHKKAKAFHVNLPKMQGSEAQYDDGNVASDQSCVPSSPPGRGEDAPMSTSSVSYDCNSNDKSTDGTRFEAKIPNDTKVTLSVPIPPNLLENTATNLPQEVCRGIGPPRSPKVNVMSENINGPTPKHESGSDAHPNGPGKKTLITLGTTDDCQINPAWEKGALTNINPSSLNHLDLAMPQQCPSLMKTLSQTSLPAMSADITSSSPDKKSPLVTREQETIQSPGHAMAVDDDTSNKESARLGLPARSGDRVSFDDGPGEWGKAGVHPARVCTGLEPDTLENNPQNDDEGAPVLSPRKEARLTSIIAELKSYKKQLIRRIEVQKVTTSDSEETEDPSEEIEFETDKSNKAFRLPEPTEQTLSGEMIVKETDSCNLEAPQLLEPSQKCRTLYHILSSGNLPESFKPAQAGNNSPVSPPNSSTVRESPIENQSEKTMPVDRSSPEKYDHKTELKTITTKEGSQASPSAQVSSSVSVMNYPPNLLSSTGSMPNSLYLVPSLFPFPYGFPPGCMFPNGMYGGFPFPTDPSAMYSAASGGATTVTASQKNNIPSEKISTTPARKSSPTNHPVPRRDRNTNSDKKRNRPKSSSGANECGVSPLPPNLKTGHYMAGLLPSGTNFQNGHHDESPKSLTNSKHGFPVGLGNSRDYDFDNSGALDLSVKKRPSPPRMEPEPQPKRQCYTNRFSCRSELVLDLSRSSAR